jgi:hypothetical protein
MQSDSKTKKYFIDRDNFAEPFQFTYRGSGAYTTCRGGAATVAANTLFWAYVALRLWILWFNPQHTLYTQALNDGLENMSPVINSVEYQAFPAI